ncbi:unnamed protein product [Amoebophrya sp. A25]|nr:unnamed protein product [Amoebophrya sp. A25]|eukprot:GSA25T00006945001.1
MTNTPFAESSSSRQAEIVAAPTTTAASSSSDGTRPGLHHEQDEGGEQDPTSGEGGREGAGPRASEIEHDKDTRLIPEDQGHSEVGAQGTKSQQQPPIQSPALAASITTNVAVEQPPQADADTITNGNPAATTSASGASAPAPAQPPTTATTQTSSGPSTTATRIEQHQQPGQDTDATSTRTMSSRDNSADYTANGALEPGEVDIASATTSSAPGVPKSATSPGAASASMKQVDETVSSGVVEQEKDEQAVRRKKPRMLRSEHVREKEASSFFEKSGEGDKAGEKKGDEAAAAEGAGGEGAKEGAPAAGENKDGEKKAEEDAPKAEGDGEKKAEGDANKKDEEEGVSWFWVGFAVAVVVLVLLGTFAALSTPTGTLETESAPIDEED